MKNILHKLAFSLHFSIRAFTDTITFNKYPDSVLRIFEPYVSFAQCIIVCIGNTLHSVCTFQVPCTTKITSWTFHILRIPEGKNSSTLDKISNTVAGEQITSFSYYICILNIIIHVQHWKNIINEFYATTEDI